MRNIPFLQFRHTAKTEEVLSPFMMIWYLLFVVNFDNKLCNRNYFFVVHQICVVFLYIYLINLVCR